MILFSANSRTAWAVLALGATLLSSCNRTKSDGSVAVDDTPTTGNVRVSIDNTFEPILKSHVDTFQKLYQYARIDASYKPEQEAMRDLLDDKVRAVVVARPLNTDEQAVFDRLKIVPRTTPIATDGVAIIVHPSNPDSLLTMVQLRDIFTGTTTKWGQVGSKSSKLGDINVVFDQNRSSTARYVQDSITRGAALSKQVFASESNPKLIDYVATHPNAIGVIGVNWISDQDDSQAQGFLQKVRVAAISKASQPTRTSDYVKPYQAYLATGEYPLRRKLYIISREARAGLGTGFASFVAGNKGQLIFLKSGLMPATGQVRLVQANRE
ncbi:PstS family phosphate ABC transporter substrate-binding protein [Solirubrum puertoriconensis]|uniref:Phosphate ABC transporter substrate-binding protein, PhoT family n=1 Tax=Solirubrum puertoriconensis TaxID=1751427 RepID=A0A9X0L397_SOLP1|nr:substrate-binding domain-containing protein [Solirubrum puertoriconensis]KUG06275.1 phosphate ABC transporter substrate-binding protein, PhoT family [Solirubrum puertoriconensis]